MSYSPMTFGLILSRFFELARTKWKLLLSVSMIYTAGLLVLIAAFAGPLAWRIYSLTQSGVEHPDFSQLAGSFWPLLLIYPLIIIWAVVYIPAVALVSLRANRNEPVTNAEAWGLGLRRFWRFLWLGIRQVLIIVLPILAGAAILIGGAAAIIALTTHNSSDSSAYLALIPLAILYYLAAICFGIWLGIRFSLSSFTAVAEDLGAARAMARSWQLTRNSFWRVFGSLFVVYLILYAVQIVFIFVLYLLVAIGAIIGVAGHAEQNHLLLGVLIGIGVFIYMVFMVVMISAQQASLHAVLAINYDDLRQRLEPEAQLQAFPGAAPTT